MQVGYGNLESPKNIRAQSPAKASPIKSTVFSLVQACAFHFSNMLLPILFMMLIPSHDYALLINTVQHHCIDAAAAANNLALLNS